MAGMEPKESAHRRHDDLGAALDSDADLHRHVALPVGRVASGDKELRRHDGSGEELTHAPLYAAMSTRPKRRRSAAGMPIGRVPTTVISLVTTV